MSLSIGIVGLPNVGKSTTFNALTKTQNAEVANYPFCTIKPNKAVVPLHDPRLDKLANMTGVPNTIYATIEFVDIAGLVKGAHKGEGLGNQFLANIRETTALIQVIRCFEDENVVHVSPNLDPVSDIEVINTELMLADIQQLERKLDKLSKQAQTERKYRPMYDIALAVQAHLNSGKLLLNFPSRDDHHFIELDHEMRFLTNKPAIFVTNVDESGLSSDNQHLKAVQDYAAKHHIQIIKLCAKLEEEMAGLNDTERTEYLSLSGIKESGLDQVIRNSFSLLDLIVFFTKNENEVRGWTIPRGTMAPRAAGAIHTDFERGFIRAEVIPFPVYEKYGNDHDVKHAGEMQLHGKEYVVQDGDIIFFRFNV